MDMNTPLENCPALILNADYRPLSYFPLSLWSWQDSVRALFRDSVVVVSEYERVVRSPAQEVRLPSVLALKEYVSSVSTPAFTRFNLFLRDSFGCQYCHKRFKIKELTFDHLIPRSRGGRTCWNNIVTACQSCNTRKGDRTWDECDMPLHREPWQPTINELQKNGRKFPPDFLHKSWDDFLYWDTELVD